MTNHNYQITCASLDSVEGSDCQDKKITFDITLHEDVFNIIGKLQEKGKIPSNDAAAFGLGLKLFTEVILKNKDCDLCASLRPHLTQIMKEIKKDKA